MTIHTASRKQLGSALLEHCRTTEPPLDLVVGLLADIRHG